MNWRYSSEIYYETGACFLPIAWRTDRGPVLLDGHHRLEICCRHGIDIVGEIEVLEFDSRNDALLWIDEHQAGRRNLTDSAYTYRLGKIYEVRKRQGSRSDLTSHQNGERLTTAEKIARQKGVSKNTVERAAEYAHAVDQIADVAGSQAKTAILAEQIDLTRQDVINLARRSAVIEKAFARDDTTTGYVRHLIRDDRRIEKYGRLDDLGTPGPGEEWSRFSVILADPPWAFEKEPQWGAASDNFSTMTIDELVALRGTLKLDKHLTPDCVLFLWATARSLPVALEFIKAWDFAYKTHLVWVKPRTVYGAYLHGKHELLLIATRGSLTPLETCHPSSVIAAEPWRSRLHSAKPDMQYDLIEQMFPGGARLELFARRRRPGWVSWGNEVGRYGDRRAETAYRGAGDRDLGWGGRTW